MPHAHLHDMHCHVDLFPDPRALVDECERAGVYTVAVTNTPSVFRACVALVTGRRFVRAALGLHPELAAERHAELALVPELLQETRYVGEIGLDYVATDVATRTLQRRVFAAFLDACAPYKDRVLTVHSRRAASDVIAMIGKNFPGTVVLHWFSGTVGELERAVESGCYFSVNGAMLASERGNTLVRRIPRERVLLETDGPFVKQEGRSARPTDGVHTVLALAEAWQIAPVDTQVLLERTLRTALTRPHEEKAHEATERE